MIKKSFYYSLIIFCFLSCNKIERKNASSNSLKDSTYISDNGFETKKVVENLENGVRREIEYLNIDGEKFMNQYWTIKGKDTLDIGNNYHIRINDFQIKDKGLQVEILLRLSAYKNFSNLYFILPKGGGFSKLNSDFSNYKEIEYDTIYNLISYEYPNNSGYNEYWAKRSVVFELNPYENDDIYLRGILIEQKDTTFIDKNNNKIIQLERYLYVNEKINEHLKSSRN
ncbi:MAG: hypothetical protein KBT58_00650 [Bizionia sp.]|nr:hypothetical protein [Bizionia sp.]